MFLTCCTWPYIYYTWRNYSFSRSDTKTFVSCSKPMVFIRLRSIWAPLFFLHHLQTGRRCIATCTRRICTTHKLTKKFKALFVFALSSAVLVVRGIERQKGRRKKAFDIPQCAPLSVPTPLFSVFPLGKRSIFLPSVKGSLPSISPRLRGGDHRNPTSFCKPFNFRERGFVEVNKVVDVAVLYLNRGTY